MDEFELIKNYFQKISNNNPSAKKLNDDVFFDKKNNLVVSVDTYNEGIHFPNFKYPNLVIADSSTICVATDSVPTCIVRNFINKKIF